MPPMSKKVRLKRNEKRRENFQIHLLDMPNDMLLAIQDQIDSVRTIGRLLLTCRRFFNLIDLNRIRKIAWENEGSMPATKVYDFLRFLDRSGIAERMETFRAICEKDAQGNNEEIFDGFSAGCLFFNSNALKILHLENVDISGEVFYMMSCKKKSEANLFPSLERLFSKNSKAGKIFLCLVKISAKRI